MTSAEIVELGIGALQGLGATTGFLLVLFIGFCVVLGFPKLRPGSRDTMVIRNLSDLEAKPEYLMPDAPHGLVDQLKTPELLEKAARKGS